VAARAALLYPVAFVAGLVLGLVLATGVRPLPRTTQAQLPEPAAAAPARPAEPAEPGELALLRAEVARLRGALAQRREAEPAAAVATAAASTGSAGADEPIAPVATLDVAQLEAELARAMNELGGYFVENRDQLAWYLVSAYVSSEQPHEALAMLERLQATDPGLYAMLGESLQQAGDPAAAADALERGLRLDPSAEELGAGLVELDPARAVAALDAALAADPPPGSSAKRLSRAEALLALGREAEARAALEALLADEPADLEALQTLGRLDPAAAEPLLRAQAAAGDEGGNAAAALARVLAAQGRAAEAIALYEELLAREPGQAAARQELLALDPERGFQRLQRAASQQAADPELWHTLAEQWLERGDPAQAVEAWLGAFERSPGRSDWEQRLLEHAPERLIAAYEASVRGSDDDELWGDLADTYWRQGRHADARAAWQRAARIDPGDGEWSGKLTAVAAGQDPFQ
jgi:tetratricopeptide (TPR) repeat protein